MKVYVITNVEAGWDCVRGVFEEKRDAYKKILGEDYNENLSDKELHSLVDDGMNIIHETNFKMKTNE